MTSSGTAVQGVGGHHAEASTMWGCAQGDVAGGHGEVGWAGGLRGLFQPERYCASTTMGALINGSMLGG